MFDPQTVGWVFLAEGTTFFQHVHGRYEERSSA